MAIAAMASGIALVVTILAKTSLALTLSCLGIIGVLTAALKWSSTPVQAQPFLKAQCNQLLFSTKSFGSNVE